MKQSTSSYSRSLRLGDNKNCCSSNIINTATTQTTAINSPGFNYPGLISADSYEKSILNVCNNLFYQSLLDCKSGTQSSSQVAQSTTKKTNSFHINQLLPELFDETAKIKEEKQQNFAAAVAPPPIVLPKLDFSVFGSSSSPISHLPISKIEKMFDRMSNGCGNGLIGGGSNHLLTTALSSSSSSSLSSSLSSSDDLSRNDNARFHRLNYIQNLLLFSKTTDEIPSMRIILKRLF